MALWSADVVYLGLGYHDGETADKRIKDLARLSVLISYNIPINYNANIQYISWLSTIFPATEQKLQF